MMHQLMKESIQWKKEMCSSSGLPGREPAPDGCQRVLSIGKSKKGEMFEGAKNRKCADEYLTMLS